jgi:hypothetical protein
MQAGAAMIPYGDYPIWGGVGMVVEGHVGAMGDGGCSEVYRLPAQPFWKNVRIKRTKRTMWTKSAGRARWG